MSTPNYELLKDAYAIIDGIPGRQISLHNVVTAKGPALDNGTICCAAGWLAHHPKFQALGLGFKRKHGHLSYRGRTYTGAFQYQMADLFNISHAVSTRLFDAAQPEEEGTDKQVWLNRVVAFLSKHNQLTPVEG